MDAWTELLLAGLGVVVLVLLALKGTEDEDLWP